MCGSCASGRPSSPIPSSPRSSPRCASWWRAGHGRCVIDLHPSPTSTARRIGCLMDIHRLLQEKSGALKLAGLQPRVETMISMTGRPQDHRSPSARRRRSSSLPRSDGGLERCGRLRLTTGQEVALDGDLLALLEALYSEVTLKHRLQVSFEDMMREIRGLVEQMTEEERTGLSRREPLPELGDLRERDARRIRAEAHVAQEGADVDAPPGGRHDPLDTIARRRSGRRSPRRAWLVPSGEPTTTRTPRHPGLRQNPWLSTLGRPSRTRPSTRTSSIRNFGTADLEIKRVSTTCGCTAALADSTVVKPGASTTLRVDLQTRTYSGKLERKILVESNDPEESAGAQGPGDSGRRRIGRSSRSSSAPSSAG